MNGHVYGDMKDTIYGLQILPVIVLFESRPFLLNLLIISKDFNFVF